MNYKAPPTVSQFIICDSLVHLIMGPFGSGKSSGAVMKILKLAQEQTPGPDGIRRSRWAAVRNTYPELRDTTKKTFEDWVPQEIRTWNDTEFKYTVKFNDVECEVLFRALDKPDDIKKLLSLELTGSWVNEAREIPRSIIDGLEGRCGRYPSKRNGGCRWSGIFMDTNPPDDDHWIYKLFEELCHDDPEVAAKYKIFKQPSGLSPEAENREHLVACWDSWVDSEVSKWGAEHREKLRAEQWRRIDAGEHEKVCQCYYRKLCVGKNQDFIDVFVKGKYGFIRDGKPVYPEYSDDIHTLKEEPQYMGGQLFLGMDFGLTPAIVVAQRTPMGQWQVLDEFTSDDIGATRFSEYVVSELKRLYPEAPEFSGWGDPAGSTRVQTDEETPFNVVQAAGLPIEPCHTNDFVLRREAVANLLTRLTLGGKPALVISPKCKKLRKAMSGGYKFKRVQVSGADRFHDAPDKNMFSHVAEALQYLLVGEGEDASALTSRDERARPEHHRFKAVPSLSPRR